MDTFRERIYNADYHRVDPEGEVLRPMRNADALIKRFGKTLGNLRHLDYGGGNGFLSELLRQSGWNSESYDPFYDENIPVSTTGGYDLITAFEVFEHVPDVESLMGHIQTLIAENGIVIFTTLLTDGHISSIDGLYGWWYASPRNGHISLFSKKSLQILATRHGFKFGSFSEEIHAFFMKLPSWADHLM